MSSKEDVLFIGCHFSLSFVHYHWVEEGGETLRAEALELAAGLT